MPAGVLVTVPVEVPARVMVSWYDVAGTARGLDGADCADAARGLHRNTATRDDDCQEKETIAKQSKPLVLDSKKTASIGWLCRT